MSYPHWDVNAAEALAEFAHAGQKDKAGVPYIEHPARVVKNIVESWEYQHMGSSERSVVLMAAWLHDVFEDTNVPLQLLDDTLCPIEVFNIVAALTHWKDEPRDEYYERIKAAGPLAVLVKRADIQDNLDPSRLMLLDVPTQRRLRDKYAHALEVLTPATSEA